MGWIFKFFFVSGFCSILYEVIWLRLSMAQFGVTSAMVSIILSMFMAGLGLGCWIGGRTCRRFKPRIGNSAMRAYALLELTIGFSAMIVPHELLVGRKLLDWLAVSSSPTYYLVSGLWVAVTLIPWCACMGATIPFGMMAIRTYFSNTSERSFSFLYLANVMGAVAGAVLPPLLIEIYGFRGTLRVGASLNVLLFISAMLISVRLSGVGRLAPSSTEQKTECIRAACDRTQWPLFLLFLTGLTSMAGEVVWIRLFTPYLGTVVYAFSTILGVYLAAMFIGSRIYRHHKRRSSGFETLLWGSLGLASLLPLIVTGPAFALPKYPLFQIPRLLLGIALFSGLLGFVTPMLVDRWSQGDPDEAGKAYAINVAGCIIGPLISGFVLLPIMSERWVLLILATPWLILGVVPQVSVSSDTATPSWQRNACYGLTAAALIVAFTFRSIYEDPNMTHRVLRDDTATVIASGEGMRRRLTVNGIGMTNLTPITKIMAHLPLAFLDHQPSNALVVCFGMGTTYRSLMSWNIPTTAVELVPSVPQLFGYFHADGPELLKSPLSRVVIDDGRRYLERTTEQFDVITIDPPPPIEAVGTSLLYSKEFYATIRCRLKPGGILHQWLPGGDAVVQAAVASALQQSFPYVRVFHSLDNWGFHLLASEHPILNRTAQELAGRLPQSAVQDLLEWGPATNAAEQFAIILGRELELSEMISRAPEAAPMQDDRPENEYFLLRQLRRRKKWFLRSQPATVAD